MEKNQGAILIRVLLSLGIVFFGINSVFFYIDNSGSLIRLLLIIGLFIQFALGLIILTLHIEKKAYQFFMALIFVGWSILNWLIAFILPQDINFWWPIYLITVSVFLLISGLRKYKKLKFGYFMPVITLFCMGVIFSLFSFDIVKVPFKTVAIVLGPVFTIIFGFVLVFFFMFQQRHKEIIIKDEDYGDFSDEELSFPKID